jgi:multidrug resistance efflux pump
MVTPNEDLSGSPKLPPIPTPAAVQWREFRSLWLAPIVFTIVAFIAWKLWVTMPPVGPVKGIGEGAVSMLASPHDGYLQFVAVPQRGWIEAGEEIARIVPFDPASKLDLLSSRLQVSRLALEPALADRNIFDFERLRVDALRLKQDLAMAQVNLDRSEKMLPRHEALLKEQLLARDIYEQTLRDRDFYKAEVEQTTASLREIETRLEQLRALAQSATPGTNQTNLDLVGALTAQIDQLQTNWNTASLIAPISGEVNFHRQAGEFVKAGEPLLVINAAKADRIVAYLKQPLPFEPEVGMRMDVITRRRQATRFESVVSQVGARLEVITNSIAFVPPDAIVDMGLPLIMTIPADIKIRPGEVVDIIWKKGLK